MILPVLLAQVAASWAHRQPPAHGWTPTESETEMTEHETTVTNGGRTATCTCGWRSTWSTADGSAHEDAAMHRTEATS